MGACPKRGFMGVFSGASWGLHRSRSWDILDEQHGGFSTFFKGPTLDSLTNLGGSSPESVLGLVFQNALFLILRATKPRAKTLNLGSGLLRHWS